MDEQCNEWAIYCHRCGFYPSDVENVIATVGSERKAINLANLHDSETHPTFVIDGSWLDRCPSDPRREVVA